MRPENVNPKNFKVESILYNDKRFSIAYGTWENQQKHLAMRWNGDSEEEIGYPKVFQHPMWFLIAEDLKIPILKSIIDLGNANNKEILAALEDAL